MLDERVGVVECGGPCSVGLGLEIRLRLIG